MERRSTEQPIRVLIINPNCTKTMTDALHPVVESLGYHNVQYTYWTCPSVEGAVPSINSPDDAARSADICIPHLEPLLDEFDAFLVACYSLHPLVTYLTGRAPSKHVTGIFEASVLASLCKLITDPGEGFAIVSTGKVWEDALTVAVRIFLSTDSTSHKFVGCETTGLNASELHELPAAEVRVKMIEATKRLFITAQKRNLALKAICLGCAGMVGLEAAVREAAVESVGEAAAKNISIIDGVKHGVGQLISMVRAGA